MIGRLAIHVVARGRRTTYRGRVPDDERRRYENRSLAGGWWRGKSRMYVACTNEMPQKMISTAGSRSSMPSLSRPALGLDRVALGDG